MATETPATGLESQEPVAQLDAEVARTFGFAENQTPGSRVETPQERRTRLEQAARAQMEHSPAPPTVTDEAEQLARYSSLLDDEPSTAPPPPAAAAESRPRTAGVLGEDILRELTDIGSEPDDQPVTLDDDTRRQEREELQAELAALQTEDDSPEYRLEIKKRFYDSKAAEMDQEAGSTFEFLQTLQAEYRRLADEHGAYGDVDWLLEVDPQLVRKWPKEARKIIQALKAFGDTQNPTTRDDLEYQIAMAAGITNRQLQDFATSDTAYSAAELAYENFLKDNPPANPELLDKFVNRNAAAIEFYARANQLRADRVTRLKKWGLIPTSPAATLAPPPVRPPAAAPRSEAPPARLSAQTYTEEDQTRFAEREVIVAEAIKSAEGQGIDTADARAALARVNNSALTAEERNNAWRDFRPILDSLRRSPPPDVPNANRVPENIMDWVNDMLRACQEDATAIEVSPATLASYLKEAVKIPVKKGPKTFTASFRSPPILTIIGERLTASGSIGASPLGISLGSVDFSVTMHNLPEGGVEMEDSPRQIDYKGLATANKDEIEARIANLNQELLNAVNARINPDWEATNFRIANGGLEFNFERKGAEEVQDYDPDPDGEE